jgi:phosphoribosylanthranilate isomerase
MASAMVKVKICGLSTAESVETAITAGASFVGFVFYAKSPRNISLQAAKNLSALARGRAKSVALIVDADDAAILSINDTVKPDYFQAHGAETPRRIAEIGKLTAKPVIKAIKVASAADIAAASDYDATAAFILFDAKAPEALLNALPGGNGIAFDWKLVAKSTGFMLSGGLHPGNVAKAIEVTGAPMVDVSSGVESAPGIKDLGLVRKFIEAALAAR